MVTQQHYLRQYARLFCHRRDIYARQRKNGSYFLVRQPITVDLIRRHLASELTCGWYALRRDNTVRWVALDADADDGLITLRRVWEHLHRLSLAAYLEDSRRGGHLWVFVEPVQAMVARTLVEQVLDRLGIDDVEVYPRQDGVTADGVGSLVRGPFGVHQLTGKRYDFLDPVQLKPIGLSLSDQLDYLLTFQVNPIHRVAEVLAELVTDSQPSHEETHTETTFDRVRHDWIEVLKAAIGDLYTFVSQYVALDAKGRGSCPFHPPDRHPSFVVNREEGYWICFHETNPETGRYLGGDAIEFYKRLKGLSFKEAVRELADQYGVTDLPF